MTRDATTEVFVEIVNVTDGAFLVSDGDHEGWVGKSLVANDDKNEIEIGDSLHLEIPLWKAEELELV